MDSVYDAGYEAGMNRAAEDWAAERLGMARAICALVDTCDSEEERNLLLCTLPLDVHITVMRARAILDEEVANDAAEAVLAR